MWSARDEARGNPGRESAFNRKKEMSAAAIFRSLANEGCYCRYRSGVQRWAPFCASAGVEEL